VIIKKEIVISRYNEDLSWIKDINSDIKVFIYNKSDESIAYEHKQLPNIGREGETYLRHIIENYDSLSENIILSQGCPFDHSKDFLSFINNNDTKSLVYISDWIALVYHYSSPQMIKDIEIIIDKFELSKLNYDSTFSAGAQYIIHRDLITSKPKDFWISIYDYYLSYIDDNASSNPWLYERIWPIIFGGCEHNSYSTNLLDNYGKL